jgi:hypothetical protein
VWEQLELRKLELFDLVAQKQNRLPPARAHMESGKIKLRPTKALTGQSLQWKNTKVGWQHSHEEHTSSLIHGKEIGEVHSGRQNL